MLYIFLEAILLRTSQLFDMNHNIFNNCCWYSGQNNGRWSVKTGGKIKITGKMNVIFGGNHRWQFPIKYLCVLISFFYVTMRVIISPKWLLKGSMISQKWKIFQGFAPNPPFYFHLRHKFFLFRPLLVALF